MNFFNVWDKNVFSPSHPHIEIVQIDQLKMSQKQV